VGRWISEDPAFDGTNLNLFVGNSPTTRLDPLGFRWRQVDPILAPTLYTPTASTDTFVQLVDIVKRRVDVPNSIDAQKYQGAIRPWPVLFRGKWITPNGRDVIDIDKKVIAQRWNNKKPTACAIYDVQGVIDHATNSLPAGMQLKVRLGSSDFENANQLGFLDDATTFFSATQMATGKAVVNAIRNASQSGRRPIETFWLIGHSGPGLKSIGGVWAEDARTGDAKLEIGDFGTDPWWQSYNDATAIPEKYPPGFWFSGSGNTNLRFIGCTTASFARSFAKVMLRDNASVYGTTELTQMNDGSANFVKKLAGGRWRVLTTSPDEEHFFNQQYWERYGPNGRR